MNNFDKVVESFSFGVLQDAVNLYKKLYQAGYSSEHLIEYVDRRKKKMFKTGEDIRRRQKEAQAKIPKCPFCKIPMVLRPAGPGPGDGSHWTCPKCRFGKYDSRQVQDIWNSLGIK